MPNPKSDQQPDDPTSPEVADLSVPVGEPERSAPAQPSSPPVALPESGAVPGLYVDPDVFVVLASRLGRPMEALPKINPSDATESIKYHVPEAYERGDVIRRADIPEIAGIDNVRRLVQRGAIGRLDHPDAQTAIAGLQYRRAQEAKVADERGIVPVPGATG